MKKYSTPDVIISGKTVDGHRVLKLNSYASEILDALKSGKSEEEIPLILKNRYGLSINEAAENIRLITEVLRGESDGVKIEEKLSESGKIVSSISGFSMYPLLKNQRDTVTVEKISRKIKKYDVLLYRRNEKYILHRQPFCPKLLRRVCCIFSLCRSLFDMTLLYNISLKNSTKKADAFF